MKIRQWLGSIQYNDLENLLSPRDEELVEHVCLEIEKQLNTKSFVSLEDEEGTPSPLVIIHDNLKTIIKELKSNWREQKEFDVKYQFWKRARRQSIETLEEIANSLNDNRKICNVLRLVGNCVSFVGGGILVASTAMIPFTLGLSTPVAVVGGITTALGSATSIGTSVTEIGLLKTKLKKASAILEEDREAFKPLESRLSSDNIVAEAIEGILSIDPITKLKRVLSALKDFRYATSKVVDRLDHEPLIKRLILHLKKELMNAFPLEIIPCLIALLLILVLLLPDINPSDDTQWTTLVNRFASVAIAPLGVLGPLLKISKGNTIVVRSTARALARGVVGVVCMALDAASIVLTSIDIKNGSLSQEGEKIREIVQRMKEEESMLDSAFNKTLLCKKFR